MILPIIFVYFSLFIAVHSNPGENVEKFNEFIKIHFGIEPSPSTSNSHAHGQHSSNEELSESEPLIQVAQSHVQHPSYEELSKFLFQVEQKVANVVLQEGQPKIDDIYEDFHNTLTTKESSLLGNLGKLLPGRHDKDNHKHEQLKSHLAFNENDQGKEQFIMLLLSFATRVAFTMGSEALKKQKWTRKIQMNSFLHAYEKMENAFHVANYGYTAKYRYYQGANLYPNDKDNNMQFELLTSVGRRGAYMRKYNFEKLMLFSQQKHRVSRLIKVLEQIDQYSPHHENFSAEESFFTDLMSWNQNQRDYPDPEYTKVKMFALKRFGMNLANRILQQEKENEKARAYFNYYKHGPAKDKLKSLFEKLKKAVEELGPFDFNNEADREVKFMNEQEMFLHYEDAIELGWKSESWIRLDVSTLFFEWSVTMAVCNSKTVKMLEENEARIKENEEMVKEIVKENEAKLEKLKKENKTSVEGIKKKFNEHKEFFESLKVDFDIASLEHAFEEVLESMAPHKMADLAAKLWLLSMEVQIAIQDEFNGLTNAEGQ